MSNHYRKACYTVPHMKKRAFTLIELLVVIAVISLLSSVVLASLNSARDKATIASGKQFANHSRSVLAAKSANNAPLVFLTFDSASSSGSGVGNLSGVTNSGLLNGSVTTWNGAIDPDTTLYGTGRHMKGPPSSLSYPLVWIESGGNAISQAIASLNFTMSIWFNTNGGSYATNCGGECRIISNAQDGNNTSMHITNTGVITILIEGTQHLTYSLSPKDAWYHLAFSVANKGATTEIALYANGRRVASNTISTPSFAAPSPNFSIGGACCASYVMPNALYDDAAFFDSTLLASDIQRLYAAGLADKKIAER